MAGNDRIFRLPSKVLPKQPIRAEDHNQIIDALEILSKEVRAGALRSSPSVKIRRGPGGTTAWAKGGKSGGKGGYVHPFKISYDSAGKKVVVRRGFVVIETVCPDGVINRPIEPTWDGGSTSDDGNSGRFDATEFNSDTPYEVICFITPASARVAIQQQGSDYEVADCERAIVVGHIQFASAEGEDGGAALGTAIISQTWSSDISVIFQQISSEGCCDDDSSEETNSSEEDDSSEDDGSDDDSSDDDSSDDSSEDSSEEPGTGGCVCPDANFTIHLLGIGSDVYNDGTRDMCFPDSLQHPCEMAIEVNVGAISCDEGEFGDIPLLANITLQFAGAYITRTVSRRFPTSFMWYPVVTASACTTRKLTAHLYFPRGSVPFGTAPWQDLSCMWEQEFGFPGYDNDSGYCSCSSYTHLDPDPETD